MIMSSTCELILFPTVNEDYNATVVVVNIQPDDTVITITIPILNDVIAEGVEMFHVIMAPFSEFVLVEEDSIAIVQILDHDDGRIYRKHARAHTHTHTHTHTKIHTHL